MTSLPEAHDFDLGDTPVWERQAREPAGPYSAFRIYRDLPAPQRNLSTVATQVKHSDRRCRYWAQTYNWRERAQAWDDACHRIEEQERLEAIRSMHALHRRAGRAALTKAVQALSLIQPENMPPSTVARLLELGAKLERSTLLTSVEELQGLETEEDIEDPWERIAAELDPALDMTQNADYVRHNHWSRDIKPVGECPACDWYHEFHHALWPDSWPSPNGSSESDRNTH